MTKKECRKIYREQRKHLSQKGILRSDDLMLIHFQQIPLPALEFVHTYLPLESENEPGTDGIVRYLKFRHPGLVTLVPKIDFETEEIGQVMLNDDTVFSINRHGIEEPESNDYIDPLKTDLVLVPLIAFDLSGYRVGYGKGYYDKFLSRCRKDVIKIGFSYFEPITKIEDLDPYDIPLDYCVTPKTLFQF